jgi:hypothetical protein
MDFNLARFKPSAPKGLLIFISGIMWMGVGVMLCTMATLWLKRYIGNFTLVFVSSGIAGALIVHHFGFLKLVNKNLERIKLLADKPCIFSFISWKSYLIIFAMVTMGITLRHSSVPKQYLSVVYICMGGALFLSSIRYFRVLIAQMAKK